MPDKLSDAREKRAFKTKCQSWAAGMKASVMELSLFVLTNKIRSQTGKMAGGERETAMLLVILLSCAHWQPLLVSPRSLT